jgi:hypothetical protein
MHKEMNNAICQAITTELTLSGINGTASTLPWDNLYNLVLSTAKLLDNAAPSLRSNIIKPMLPKNSRGQGVEVLVSRRMVDAVVVVKTTKMVGVVVVIIMVKWW